MASSVPDVRWHWRLQLDAPNELLFNVICCFILAICCKHLGQTVLLNFELSS
ncbi:hypothetical protein RND71_005198 [Anisodus tanguticus]|uniref:Uncharacterized protein n=1 Tax=Anisodus tanguticus TaxID=243964 RepID=A0AAE1SRN9_9SOLA|nr:hypothetical protein RND71_005198 [Anisodus tanguticus]